MEIKQIDKRIEDIIERAEYLGCGASKEAYLKNGIVYKVPRGRFLLEQGGFGSRLNYPSTNEEINQFLEVVSEYDDALVWPLGQFATEIIIWKAIQQLREEGLRIDCFAEIKDYYLDSNGVIVIEQEDMSEDWFYDDYEEEFDELEEEIYLLNTVLFERFNIKLRDFRTGNCGLNKEGKLKLFDFGISTTTDLDSYDGYSGCRCRDSYDSSYRPNYGSCNSYYED